MTGSWTDFQFFCLYPPQKEFFFFLFYFILLGRALMFIFP